MVTSEGTLIEDVGIERTKRFFKNKISLRRWVMSYFGIRRHDAAAFVLKGIRLRPQPFKHFYSG